MERSFGGAPAFTLAGIDERIAGVAIVASQKAEAICGARLTAKKKLPVLFRHGRGIEFWGWSSKKPAYGVF